MHAFLYERNYRPASTYDASELRFSSITARTTQIDILMTLFCDSLEESYRVRIRVGL